MGTFVWCKRLVFFEILGWRVGGGSSILAFIWSLRLSGLAGADSEQRLETGLVALDTGWTMLPSVHHFQRAGRHGLLAHSGHTLETELKLWNTPGNPGWLPEKTIRRVSRSRLWLQQAELRMIG